MLPLGILAAAQTGGPVGSLTWLLKKRREYLDILGIFPSILYLEWLGVTPNRAGATTPS